MLILATVRRARRAPLSLKVDGASGLVLAAILVWAFGAIAVLNIVLALVRDDRALVIVRPCRDREVSYIVRFVNKLLGRFGLSYAKGAQATGLIEVDQSSIWRNIDVVGVAHQGLRE